MKSIRRQLTLTILTGFILLLAASGGAVYFFTRLALIREFDAGLRTKALTIMSLTENDNEGIHLELPGTFFQGGHQEGTPQYYELWLTNGVVRERSPSLKDADLPRNSGTLAQPVYWNFDLPDDADGRAIGLQFTIKREEGEAQPAGPQDAIVVVAEDRRTLDATLATLASVLVAAGVLTMIITVPLVGWALRCGHAPLGALARQAAAINADSLQTRFPVADLPEELLPIAGRLNDLLARLEGSFERERRFSADLAHELRTPLAELRTQAEVELAWPENEETEKHRDTLNIALQMEAMVASLLELARCEDGKITLKKEVVHLAPLVAEVWQTFAGQAADRQLDIRVEVPPDAVMPTDRTLLRSILVNLISNAVEYTPPSGRGEIRWNREHGELTVSNTVQDLNTDDLPHLFERLWRKDTSRTGGNHAGLGLALSQAFARALGCRLEARLDEGRTLTMTLRAGKADG